MIIKMKIQLVRIVSSYRLYTCMV